jgi:uncharacterized glyoxalase superfamily protein PhnB
MAEPTPSFTGVHLFARDMAATAAFYRLLGITVEGDAHFSRGISPDGADLAFGSHALTLGYDPNFQPSTGGAIALQFSFGSREAVDAAHGRLVSAGHASRLAPFDAFWGSRYAEVLDPDGVIVGLQSPRDDAKVSPPPVV